MFPLGYKVCALNLLCPCIHKQPPCIYSIRIAVVQMWFMYQLLLVADDSLENNIDLVWFQVVLVVFFLACALGVFNQTWLWLFIVVVGYFLFESNQ